MNKFLVSRICLALTLVFLSQTVFYANWTFPKAPGVTLWQTAAAGSLSYYVAPNGDDSNPGTSAAPWRTIQKAANTMVAGDAVIVAAGNYPERVQVTNSGQSGAPITYQAQGAVVTQGFTVSANYITIRGFEITNTADDWTHGNGIFVSGNNCLIEDNYIYFATHMGILLYATVSNPTVTSNCIVRNNQLYRNTNAGIDVRGRNNLIEGNEIWGGTTGGTQRPGDSDGIYFFGSGHIIRSNYIHNIHDGIPDSVYSHTDCFQTWGDVTDHEVASNIIIERNFCRNVYVQTENVAGQGFMIEGGASNLTIRNNVIQAYKDVNVNGGNNLALVNNIFAGDVLASTCCFPVGVTLVGSPNTIMKNNIFYDQPATIISIGDSVSKQGLDIGYNLAYRSDGRPLWGSPYPHDLWGVDPLFVNPAGNDFHLQAQSPAIDAGTWLTNVTDDMDGNPRPQGSGFDIGAFEFPYLRKASTPVAARVNDLVNFAIIFVASGNLTTVTDTLPTQFTYLSSTNNCVGVVDFNPSTRQMIYSGTPSAGQACTIQISTSVNTSQRMATINTATLDNALTPPQSSSTTVILNGISTYLPIIFRR